MAEKFIKPIREQGIIISKSYKEARAAFKDMNGKEWPASEEKFSLRVISCDEDEFDPITGIMNGTDIEYTVDKETFDKARFGQWAKVKYKVSQYGTGSLRKEPLGLVLLEEGEV